MAESVEFKLSAVGAHSLIVMIGGCFFFLAMGASVHRFKASQDGPDQPKMVRTRLYGGPEP
jgi:hypothetical protein